MTSCDSHCAIIAFGCIVRRLQDENAVLRDKQEMQFRMLRGYESTLGHMTTLMCDLAAREDSEEELYAVSEAMQALRSEVQVLMEQLHPSTAPHSTTAAPNAQQHNTCGDTSAEVSSGGGETAVPGSAGSVAPATPYYFRWSYTLWSSVTAEEVLEMKGITTQELAGEVVPLKVCCAGLCWGVH